MAGGSDGSLRRCTAKSEAAAVTEPQASLTSCSNKRKAKKEAGSSGQEADKTAPAPAPAKAEKAGVNKYRLSAKEIKWILAQKPEPPPARYQALKRSNPELTPRPGEEDDKDKVLLYCVARAFYEREERLPKMQEGVRSELASKGYVEVDGDYLKRKAEVQAVIDRESLSLLAFARTRAFRGVRGAQPRIRRFCEKALHFPRNHETTEEVHGVQ
jgi:hypothetical protein